MRQSLRCLARLARNTGPVWKQQTQMTPFRTFFCKPMYRFAEEKPKVGLQAAGGVIDVTETTVGEEDVKVVATNGALSILDQVEGVKDPKNDLFVLHFTCSHCGTRNIRSFTKHSYQKGVVLARCGGCQQVHLVADNLGWFSQEPTNIETLHEGQVKKVHDPVAIAKFLNHAFDKQNGSQSTPHNPSMEQIPPAQEEEKEPGK